MAIIFSLRGSPLRNRRIPGLPQEFDGILGRERPAVLACFTLRYVLPFAFLRFWDDVLPGACRLRE
jgi:hypothetical protein